MSEGFRFERSSGFVQVFDSPRVEFIFFYHRLSESYSDRERDRLLAKQPMPSLRLEEDDILIQYPRSAGPE